MKNNQFRFVKNILILFPLSFSLVSCGNSPDETSVASQQVSISQPQSKRFDSKDYLPCTTGRDCSETERGGFAREYLYAAEWNSLCEQINGTTVGLTEDIGAGGTVIGFFSYELGVMIENGIQPSYEFTPFSVDDNDNLNTGDNILCVLEATVSGIYNGSQYNEVAYSTVSHIIVDNDSVLAHEHSYPQFGYSEHAAIPSP